MPSFPYHLKKFISRSPGQVTRLFSTWKSLEMPRNIEIKASTENIEEIEQSVQALADGGATNFHQRDVFFRAQSGRLKLRYQTGNCPKLIYYHRKDVDGPKLSDYRIVEHTENQARDLEVLLSMALGTLGEVRKRRALYMIGQTRVHIDHVDGLGSFLEFEVVLLPRQTVAEGEEIAKQLMETLKIKDDTLIDCSYMDLLTRKAEAIDSTT